MEYESRERKSFGGNRFGGGSRGGGNGGGFKSGGPRRNNFSPVRDGEEINAVIEAVAEKGDGIAKKSGFVIFVPGTKVGDKVKIKVKKVAKKVAFAEVIGAYEEGASSQQAPARTEQAEESEETETAEEENYDASQDSEEF